jgi:hypothetical protein
MVPVTSLARAPRRSRFAIVTAARGGVSLAQRNREWRGQATGPAGLTVSVRASQSPPAPAHARPAVDTAELKGAALVVLPGLSGEVNQELSQAYPSRRR